MTWARLDDQFHSHPKLAEIDPELMLSCAGLDCLAISWCAQHLTDGMVPKAQPLRLAGRPADQEVAELVRVGLWKTHSRGYEINDYLDYNPSRAQVLAERKRKSEGGKKGARSRWEHRSGSGTDSSSHGSSYSSSHGSPHGQAIGGSNAPGPVPADISIRIEGEEAVENSGDARNPGWLQRERERVAAGRKEWDDLAHTPHGQRLMGLMSGEPDNPDTIERDYPDLLDPGEDAAPEATAGEEDELRGEG